MQRMVVLQGVLVLIFLCALNAWGATVICRSVGPGNTSALASGGAGSTLTISGSTATFSSSLPDSVGVGDVIQYDPNNYGYANACAFIHGRIDAQHYTVKNAAGSAPVAGSALQLWSVFRAYTSLANAVSGTENTGIFWYVRSFDPGSRNLVNYDEEWHFACYADNADTAAVSWNSWTTGADNFIRIYTPCLSSEVGTSQRHHGTWSTSAYHLEVNNTTAFTTNSNYMRLEGLQIRVSTVNGTNQRAVYWYNQSGQADIRVSSCILRGVGGTFYSNHSGFDMNSDGSGGNVACLWNNIVYGFNGAAPSRGLFLNDSDYVFYAYNNTVVNCNTGIELGEGSAVVKNNIAQDCTDGFAGGFSTASDYNLSDLPADAPGPHAGNSLSLIFFDKSSNNYHLELGDVAAIDAGTDLSADPDLAFSDDIDGDARSGAWDIGADEYTGPRATPTTSPTISPTCTATPTVTPTPTATHSATLTRTVTASVTRTATISPTRTGTPTCTATPTVTPTPTITLTFTITPTATPTLLPETSLSHLVVYPNPYRADIKPRPEIRFHRLTRRVQIRIYDLSGGLVRFLDKDDGQVDLSWDLRNQQGTPVASGVYVYVVTSGEEKKRGKIVLMR